MQFRVMSKHYQVPSENRYAYGYEFYNSLLKVTGNPDYHAEGLPRQSAQQSIKKCVRDLNSYFASMKAYKKDKSAFTGVPKIPGYHRKGGHVTAIITNQDAVLKSTDRNNLRYQLKLPLTKDTLAVGNISDGAKVKEVKITPDNGTYVIYLVLQQELPDVTFVETPKRIAAIDMGVDNLMAVTNNCNLKNLLYKGGVAKSVNQLYNKKIADIVSKQTLSSKEKFTPTEEYYAVTNQRNDALRDLFHKTAKHFLTWCVDNRIDTIVMGMNRFWKQECDIESDSARQNFDTTAIQHAQGIYQIPCRSKRYSLYRAGRKLYFKGFLRRQRLYPVYGKDDDAASFSGIHGPKHYRGMHKKSGFHGIYQTKDGSFLNSDLNGSANILRKAFPDAFQMEPDFEKVCIIKHPDLEKAASLKKRQLEKHTPGTISHAKAKRLRRKGKLAA